MSFKKLGLSDELLNAIQAKGYSQTTPVQEKAIPFIMQGLDILAGAQTGTGKTAAFALPILNRLQQSESKRRRIRALVLTPTRELASQVGDSFRDYGSNLRFKTAVIYGGVSIRTQKDKLRNGVDIVVATPGRLLDHLNQKTLDLSEIEVFVLDEGDRMLDMGFIVDIKKIIKHLPQKRQNLLFSATFPKEIKSLAARLLNFPKQIQMSSQNSTAENVKQKIYPVDQARKRELLIHCIKKENWFQVLVFIRTKRAADKLAKQLNKQRIKANAIHGNKTQGARTRALKSFKDGEIQVLVATDVAARGIDIPQVALVINYDIPNRDMVYFHRIGRTARAGAKGRAITMVSYSSVGEWNEIKKQTKVNMTDLNEKLGIEIKIPDPLKRRVATRQYSHRIKNHSSQVSRRHMSARNKYDKRKKKIQPITRSYFSQKKRW